MTQARQMQAAMAATPYFHCSARCVRGAMLWGMDERSGRDYSYRQQWALDKLSELAEVFTISVCAYALMPNHYHLVLYVNADQAQNLSDADVALRWGRLFKLPESLQQAASGGCSASELAQAQLVLQDLRNRLSDISWYLRSFNEAMARRINREDDCHGRFWEGRFKSQAILDQAALLACCLYVDLNPLRAGLVTGLQQATATALYQRSLAQAWSKQRDQATASSPALPLHPFAADINAAPASGLPFSYTDYFAVAEWTVQQLQTQASSVSDTNSRQAVPALLSQLGFERASFLAYMQAHALRRGSVIGQLERLRAYSEHRQLRRISGISLPMPAGEAG